MIVMRMIERRYGTFQTNRLFQDSTLYFSLSGSPCAVHRFFLYRHFKVTGKTLWPQVELISALRDFQEEMHESGHDVLWEERPEKYLDSWSSGETHWLRRSLGKGSEYVFQLTPDSEAVLGFFDQRFSSQNSTIGTGSRLKRAIEMLAEIVFRSSTEPDERIRYLKAEKEKIEREIDKIQADGIVMPEKPAILREDFSTAVAMLKQLQSDFRAVEEHFKDITRQVQQKIHEQNEVRGEILGSVFESDDMLKNKDQGVSFREFCRFLYSDPEQDRFYNIVDKLKVLDEISSFSEELKLISQLIPLLTDERCAIDGDELYDDWTKMIPYMPDAKKSKERFDKALSSLAKLQFVKQLGKSSERWEIRRIIKARLPLEILENLLRQLQEYYQSLDESATVTEVNDG
jgi:uncharacterized membrane-anchored protein YhcB (DUF1043 family)